MKKSGYGQPAIALSISSRAIATALAMLLFLAVQSAVAAEIVRGPYLQSVTPDSIIVRWRTDVASDARVRFGASTGSLTQTAYSSANGTEHEVKLTGLTAATRYYYDVGSSAEKLAGDSSFNFVTSPVPHSAAPTRIWVTGDMGTDNGGSREVRDGYKAFAGSAVTNLWLLLGDNAYEDGTDSEYQTALFDVYPQLLRQIPLFSTFGNHDGHTANASNESGPYFDIFTFPRNGEAGGLPSGTEAYFSFDYGNIHFVNLDSYGSDDDLDGPMMTWLKDDLAATDKDWVIALWHHPAYSRGSHYSDDSYSQTAMRENAVSILENYGVDLVMSGHSHAYERSYFMDGHYGKSDTFDTSMIMVPGYGHDDDDGAYTKSLPRQPHEGAVYVVAGNAGRVSDSGSLDHPAMLVNSRDLGSLVLDVAGNRMDVSMIGTQGETLDYFTIEKGNDISPPSLRSAEVKSSSAIELGFSESLNQLSAEHIGNYRLTEKDSGAAGPAVLAAKLAADGRTVTVTTAPLTVNTVYRLSIQKVADLDGNAIAAGASAEVEYSETSVLSFQNGVSPGSGYSGTRDTFISGANPDSNYGSDTLIEVDGSDAGFPVAGLLHWDISAIPADAVVKSASITVDVKGSTNGTYHLFELKRAWSESGATWKNSGVGGAWSAAGAQGSSDHDADVLAQFSNLAVGSRTIELNSVGLDVLQAWISGQRVNNGFLLYHPVTSDGLDFSSSEAGSAVRPRLTITVTGAIDGTEPPGETEPPGDTTPPDETNPPGDTDPSDTTEVLEAPYNIETKIPGKYALWVGWEKPVTSKRISGYRVWVNDVERGVVSGLEDKIFGLDPGTKYRISVATVFTDGKESARIHHRVRTLASNYSGPIRWKKSKTKLTEEALTMPNSFRTVARARSALWIAWNKPANSTGVIGYHVWIDDADMGVVAGQEYQAKNLEPSTTYRFLVAAVNSSGWESSRASYLETTTSGDVAAPTGNDGSLSQEAPVNLAPQITGSPASYAQVGSLYVFQPQASDPDKGPKDLSYTIENKPDWATFAATTGKLSGVPGTSDVTTTRDIRIHVSDGEDTASLAAFDLTVRAASGPVAGVNSAGAVKFFVDAKSDFDDWTRDPSSAQQAWMRDNYYRMQTYKGYFDDRLDWYPNAWVYKDSYALKPDWSITSEHPEWVLRDSNGNMLYIPFACSGGTCSQYAADIGNQNFRNWWLDDLENIMAAGYIGVWVDDVNLKWRVSNGDKEFVNPIDPRTGVAMSYADYQRYFAEYMEAIRARFPQAEIAHNTIWSTEAADGNNQYLTRQVLAADYINLERGVTDGNGLDGGNGKYGFETFLSYIDWVHSLGRKVILDDDDSDTPQERDLELAVYFLINNGGDLLGADGDRDRMNPDNFWSGYYTNLGDALGERYIENGIFRRDFTCGVVLVNQPEEPTRTIELGGYMTNLDGNLVNSVTLGDAEGEVLVKACP